MLLFCCFVFVVFWFGLASSFKMPYGKWMVRKYRRTKRSGQQIGCFSLNVEVVEKSIYWQIRYATIKNRGNDN